MNDLMLQILTAVAGVLSALVACLAVFWGPKKAAETVRDQIKAELVSKNRQAWINAVRDSITEFLAALQLEQLSVPHRGESEEGIHRVMREFTRVRLLLNPAEKDHQQLVAEMRNTIAAIDLKSPGQAANVSSKDLFDVSDRAIELAQVVLKREWNRVKVGE
jgi:hypothetical protein